MIKSNDFSVLEATDHKIIFQMTPELEKKRAFSLDPAKKENLTEKTGNLLDTSFRTGNEGNMLQGSQRKDAKNRKINAADNSFITIFVVFIGF